MGGWGVDYKFYGLKRLWGKSWAGRGDEGVKEGQATNLEGLSKPEWLCLIASSDEKPSSSCFDAQLPVWRLCQVPGPQLRAFLISLNPYSKLSEFWFPGLETAAQIGSHIAFVIHHMLESFPECRDFWGRCGVLGWRGEPMGIRHTPVSAPLPASWAVGFFHSSFCLV